MLDELEDVMRDRIQNLTSRKFDGIAAYGSACSLTEEESNLNPTCWSSCAAIRTYLVYVKVCAVSIYFRHTNQRSHDQDHSCTPRQRQRLNELYISNKKRACYFG
jgi:hypothetical protein